MPPETQMQHPASALFVGEGTDSLATPLQAAQDAGWRFSRAADVYAATARLLTAGTSRPEVVLVLVESLRGDELRFFDLLSRRWPGLPAVAIYSVSAEDRRLEACRRRGVTVLPAQHLPDWLAGRPADSTPVAEAGATQDMAGVEVDLDLPDNLTESPEQEASADRVEQAESADADHSEEDLPAGIHLTPWSSQPRPQRRRVWRGPAPAAPARSSETPAQQAHAAPPAPSEQASPPQSPSPAAPDSQAEIRSSPPDRPPPTHRSPTLDWEHGLLTPDELRALLDDSDLDDPEQDAGPQEAQP
jgi:hypothetical protein